MILSLCLLLAALDLSKQEICSASGTLRAPILYLSQMSAQLGESIRLQCAVISQAPAIRIFFCKDGEEILSQMGSEEKVIYDYDHMVTTGSAGNYACGYEIKNSDNRMNRSKLSPVKHLRVTGSSKGVEELTHTGLGMSPAVWVVRCVLVVLLLVSAPIITFVLEKWGLPSLQAWRRLVRGRSNITGKREAGSGRTPLTCCEQGSCLGRYQCPTLSRCWEDTIGQCCAIGCCDNNLCPNFSSLLQFSFPSPQRDTASHSALQTQTFARYQPAQGPRPALSATSPAINCPVQATQPSSFLLYK